MINTAKFIKYDILEYKDSMGSLITFISDREEHYKLLLERFEKRIEELSYYGIIYKNGFFTRGVIGFKDFLKYNDEIVFNMSEKDFLKITK